MAINKAPAKGGPLKVTAKPKVPARGKAASALAKPPAGSKRPAAGKAAPAAKAAQTTVTLKQLAEQFSENHTMPKKQAEAVLVDVVGMLVTHLKAGDRLRIGGLGILEVKNRPARTGRNPATGATIQIAASKKIAFRPAKELKDAI
jgi:DNA-binding protein HU-beta